MPLGIAQRASAGSGEFEVTSRPSATNRQRFTMSRDEQTLVFESLQRCVQRADRVIAPGSRSEIASDGEAIRFVLKAGDREQGGEFERPESCSRHYSQFVEQISSSQASWRSVKWPQVQTGCTT